MKITMLGCGSSSGVPFIGCDCKVCRSGNPKNKRTRVSCLIEINGVNILIDTSPDLRAQALRHDLRKISAVLYTHDHADHSHGIDDLRSFNYLSGNSLPVYSNAATLASLKQRFSYAFDQKPPTVWVRPSLIPHILPDAAIHPFSLSGIQDCIRYKNSYGHAHLEQTLGWIQKVRPEQAILTHMSHDFDYDTLKAELPSGVVPGYDGMVIAI